VDNLLVAGVLGPTSMSFYSIAWNASRVPIGICAKAISFVLVPTFAHLSDDPKRAQRGLRESLRLLYLTLAPFCAILLVSAPSLIIVLFGAKWLPLVPCLRVMCFTILVGPLLDTSYALLISQGRAQFAALGTSIRIGLLILILQPMAIRWGLLGAAYADLITSVALTVALHLTARVSTGQMEWRLTSALALPLLAASCAGLLAWKVGIYWPTGLIRLVGEAGCVLIVYPMVISLFGGRDRLSNLTTLISNGLRRTTMGAESHA
jgi:O-antigen/teichoic acid export membrane protein